MYKELESTKEKLKSALADVETKDNLLSCQGVTILNLLLFFKEMIKKLNKEKADWKIEKQGLVLKKECVE